MATTLYRKYRPQTFQEVVGQNHIKTTIQNELESGKIAHAFLFSGPRGLGKTTIARLLAKSVNCLERKEGQSEPCNSCGSCKEIMEARSLDVIEIDAASHTGVDNVRENIIGNSRFTPTSRKFKVFIIDEVHMLSVPAFNALLKTLEEPPAHAMFVLATTEIHKVPETIISRCQHFEFHKVSQQEIVQRLNHIINKEGVKVDKQVLENVAYYAGGCIRDAESLLGQILSLGDKEITLEQAELVLPRSDFDLVLQLIEYLNKKDPIQAITLINRLVQDGVDLEKFAGELIEVLRRVLLIKVSRQLGEFSGSLDKDLEKRIADISEQISLESLINMIEIFVGKRQDLKFADILQLPLELAVLEIIKEEPSPFESKDSRDDSDGNSGDSIFSADRDLSSKQEGMKEATKKSEPPKPKKTLNRVKLSLQQVKDKWGDLLDCLKKYNQSLASTLKICQPGKIKEDGILEICSKHKFHEQRLNDSKNRQILEMAMEETFGMKLAVKTIVVEDFPDHEFKVSVSVKNKDDSPADAVDNLLQTFGGQVVE